MVHHQKDYIQQHLNSAQITNTLRHSRYFLISILIICLYIFCVYLLHYQPTELYFNVWFVGTEIMVSLCWLINTLYFKPGQYHLRTAHRWLNTQCLLIGACIAIGIYTIYIYLPSVNAQFTAIQALTLSALLLIVTQAFGLTFLTKNQSNFCLSFFLF